MAKAGSAKSGKRGLAEYHAKRHFEHTPEPAGDPGSAAEAARGEAEGQARSFCVQKHLASHLHYDFRLQHKGVLLSWAVPKGPSLNPKDKRLSMHTEDHPLEYGGFEGVIPEGYGAGIVMLWDQGTWVPEPGFEDVDRALGKGELKFRLEGYKLKGSWVIVQTRRGTEGDASRSWLLIKHRDDWAGDLDVTKVAPLSIKSGGDFVDILAAENPSIWESHRPAKGGEAGAMFQDIIRKAVKLKQENDPAAAKKPVVRATKKKAAKAVKKPAAKKRKPARAT